jgi:hypothetical protein
MLTRRQFLILMGSAGALAIGAAGGVIVLTEDEQAAASEPTIRLGEEACATCGMVIDDTRFAAAWIEPSGREQHFDDIGCLITMRDGSPPPDGTRYFVHDYLDQGWLDAGTARFAKHEQFRSPMAYGIAAFAHDEAAHEAMHDEHMAVFSWHELPGHMESMGHGHD